MSTIENGIPVLPDELEAALSAFWTDASDKGIYGSVRDFRGEAEVDLRAAISRLITPPPEPNLVGSDAMLECLKDARSKLTDGSEIDLDYIDEVIAAAENNVGAEHVIEALEDCKDYFDNRSAADCDQDGFVPNKEMDLLSKVQFALDHMGMTKTVTHTKEAERLHRMVERRDEFIVGKGLWESFKESSREA